MTPERCGACCSKPLPSNVDRPLWTQASAANYLAGAARRRTLAAWIGEVCHGCSYWMCLACVFHVT